MHVTSCHFVDIDVVVGFVVMLAVAVVVDAPFGRCRIDLLKLKM